MASRISLVTPTYNQAPTLPETIESVLRQDMKDHLEYIVVDALSTDSTKEIIRKYEPEMHRKAIRFRYLRESDRGQADAINKGWRIAEGEILGYLNSDDLLELDALQNVLSYFRSNPDVQWAYGGWNLMDENGKFYKSVSHSRFDKNRLLNYCNIGQPSCFFRKNLLQEFGDLDENLHLAMDYDLWLRFATRYEAGIIPAVLSAMRYHKGAKSTRQTRQQAREIYEIASRYTPAFSVRRLMQYFYYLRGVAVTLLKIDISNRISQKQRFSPK